eukprot:12900786-Alexandrium_andersonii.AAC.1
MHTCATRRRPLRAHTRCLHQHMHKNVCLAGKADGGKQRPATTVIHKSGLPRTPLRRCHDEARAPT